MIGKFGSSGKGLLSKMARFVRNPTTQWSDLEPAPSSLINEPSHRALKEMIERKRRNDFVRNREFNMLRKLRRKETLTEEDQQAGSFYPSGQYASTGERAQTLRKIDEIEAQMSSVWLRRKSDQGQAAPLSDQWADADEPAFQDQDDVQPVGARAFAPTEMMDYTPTELTRQSARPELEPGPTRVEAAPPPPPSSSALLSGFGSLSDFQVDVVAGTTKLDPMIEEAAIRFANGDAAGAEADLCELVIDGGVHEDNVDTWLTLLDLYRASGEQGKFNDAAAHFVARFGRSAPQWEANAQPDDCLSTMDGKTLTGAIQFHWVCPVLLNTQAVTALDTLLANHVSPWYIDWSHLQTIDPEALPALRQVFQRWAEQPVQLRFFQVERLLRVLAENCPTEDRQVDPLWWQVRLALLRVLRETEAFDLVALNYCVTYEVSPPAWEDPQNDFSPMTEEGRTLTGAETQPLELPPHAETVDLMSDAVALPDTSVVRLKLAGELLGSADSVLKHPGLADSSGPIEFNCGNLLRVDFGAAGDLLNWSTNQQAAGKQVNFYQVNRIVAAFFGIIGITDVARVVLRVD